MLPKVLVLRKKYMGLVVNIGVLFKLKYLSLNWFKLNIFKTSQI